MHGKIFALNVDTLLMEMDIVREGVSARHVDDVLAAAKDS